MVLRKDPQMVIGKRFPKIHFCLRGYIPLISAMGMGKTYNKQDYTLGFQNDLGTVNSAFWSNWPLKSYLVERRKHARSLCVCVSIL